MLSAGCTSAESKLGRGVSNTAELMRLSEFNRSIEQHSLYEGPNSGFATGLMSGIDHSIVRTGVGLYEIVTFPIPPYHPVLTNYLTPEPHYPDAYSPRKWNEPVLDTDHSLGFGGGDEMPWFPGSRFRVFDN